MSLRFGDIVLVPFPFSDQTAIKRRPAVVISNPAYNLARPDVVITAITSRYAPHRCSLRFGSATGRRPAC